MKQFGSVRIIGGKWRGRKLKVPDLEGLRPTPDRVRETLFNWLTPVIEGANCLDLFAGSGALGFEALSRGAAYVEMVDQSAAVIELLKQEKNVLAADNLVINQRDVPQQLTRSDHQFDIVFLDPPYASDLLLLCSRYLENNHFLAADAYIYLEAKRPLAEADLPSNWQLIKSKRAGQVYYYLAHRHD